MVTVREVPEENNVEDDEAGGENEAEEGENEGEPEDLSVAEQVRRQREQYQPTKLEKFMAIVKSLLIRALILYFVMSFLRRPSEPAQQQQSVQKGGPQPPNIRVPSTNLFENGTVMDMYVYISEDENFNDFKDEDSLFWSEKGLVYGDWNAGENGDGSFTRSGQIVASENVQNNGSLYIHVYLVKHGQDLNAPSKKLSKIVIQKNKLLNRYKKRRYTKTHNLLTGETAASPEDVRKAETLKEEIVSHWHPNLTINLVVDHTGWVRGGVPPPLDEYIEFLPLENLYKPVLYLNDYWNLMREYQPINSTIKVLNFTVTFQPISLFKWQLYTAQTMRNKWTAGIFGDGGADAYDDDDQDSIKEAFLETSPYLLGLTMVVSILHSIFEFLAFKNDIQFWNNRQSLEGLSVRSVFFNVFQALIVLLYVLDNETNTVVRISCFVGLGIEIWKIHKVMDVRIIREERMLGGLLPRISIKDKGSYVESSTRVYDQLAFKYLSWVLFPLLAAYSVYSVIYGEHKGWYSFVLSMLYGFLLTFGFIMMTPQLFINYKLKSVAHLPWRMLTYKFLNTFIDDIFAFVIKMPTMYRLGCFRDDIVFCIFLYQRWIYKTDPTRMNEFGFSAEMEKEATKKKEGAVVSSSDSSNGAVSTNKKRD